MEGVETIRVEIDGAIGHLTLARPEKLNPLSARCLDELARAASWFDERPEVRSVIVRGASLGSGIASTRRFRSSSGTKARIALVEAEA